MAQTAHRSSGFGSFFTGVVFTLVALAALAFWMGAHAPASRVAQLEQPQISIPLPRIPAPPGTVPKAGGSH